VVLDGAGNEVEVAKIRFAKDGGPLLVDPRGNEIRSPRALLRSDREPRLRSLQLKLETLEAMGSFDRSGLVQPIVVGDRTVFLDPSGHFTRVDPKQTFGEVLMAQSGSLVYYTISANNIFAIYRTMLGPTVPMGTQFPTDQADLDDILDFAAAHGLAPVLDPEALAVEIKAAWVEASSLATPEEFIQITAVVPKYDPQSPTMWIRDGWKTARLALVGLHIAGSTAGHPELLWATFEHVRSAPTATFSYLSTSGQKTVTQDTVGDWLLCASGASAPFDIPRMELIGEDICRIDPLEIGPSNILRQRPWGLLGTSAAGNTEIIDINHAVRSRLDLNDVRRNYVQVGTTWTIFGMPPNGSNDVGTNRLANTAIETFIQDGDQTVFQTCFDCHMTNTTGVSFVFDTTAPLF